MSIELPLLKLPSLPNLPSRSMADHERYIIELREVMRCRERLLEARERILLARVAELEADAERLDYIERTFSGCTTQDRYMPIRMIWGKGCNGRTLREACDKYMARDAERGAK